MLLHGVRGGWVHWAGVLGLFSLISLWSAAAVDGQQPEEKQPPKPEQTQEAPEQPASQPIPVSPAPTEAEAKVYEALEQSTELKLIETPLEDVMVQLRDKYMIPIVIDRKALVDANIGPDVLVTANVQGISLRSALQLMLSDSGLSYSVHDEVLLITTRQRADALTDVRMYDVAEILAPGTSADDLATVLSETLQESSAPLFSVYVTPEEEVAEIESRGASVSRRSIRPYQHMLIVRDTTIGHHRIFEALEGIRAGVLRQRQLDAERAAAQLRQLEAAGLIQPPQEQPPQDQPQEDGQRPPLDDTQDRQDRQS